MCHAVLTTVSRVNPLTQGNERPMRPEALTHQLLRGAICRMQAIFSSDTESNDAIFKVSP